MKLKYITLATLLAMPTIANAETNTDDGWVAGFIEFYSPDNDIPDNKAYLNNGSGTGYGFEVGTFFTDNWAARFELSKLSLEADPIKIGNRDADTDGLRAGIDAMYFTKQGGPYFFTGLKHINVAETRVLGNVGIGKQWQVKDKWRVITEGAYYHDFGQGLQDIGLKIGISYTFGEGGSSSYSPKDSDNDGVYDNQDNCPNTPYGTSVDSFGCANDSDGDGIINSQDQCPNTPQGTKVGANGCALAKDSDKDGVADDKDNCANTPMGDKVDTMGCSIFEENEVSVSLQVNFANNSAEVGNPNDPQFQDFADFMQRFANTEAEIAGHTSAVGKAEYNQMLSEKRAKAVRQLLINQYGIDGGRLTAVGYGETQLLDDANTAQAHRMNRRIEAKVTAVEKVKAKK